MSLVATLKRLAATKKAFCADGSNGRRINPVGASGPRPTKVQSVDGCISLRAWPGPCRSTVVDDRKHRLNTESDAGQNASLQKETLIES